MKLFHFTRTERQGVAALLLTCAVLYGWPEAARLLYPSNTETEAWLATDLAQFRQTAAALTRASQAPPDTLLFAFDPNTTSADSLMLLGFPERLAHTVERYREKGGRFRKKEDLLKIYGFPEPLYRRLEPYLQLPETGEKSRPAWAATADKPRPKTALLDVNTAAAEAWQRLPGIGAARAAFILRFREKLGGFVSVEQVAETRGLPDSVFQQIRPMLVCASGPYRQIHINHATAEEMNEHPYISARQARVLTAYRGQHGPFASAEALMQVHALRDSAWWRKIRPYLSVE